MINVEAHAAHCRMASTVVLLANNMLCIAEKRINQGLPEWGGRRSARYVDPPGSDLRKMEGAGEVGQILKVGWKQKSNATFKVIF